MKFKYIVCIFAYCLATMLYVGCDNNSEDHSAELNQTQTSYKDKQTIKKPETDASSSEVHIPLQDELLTIDEYSLGTYPYYNHMIPTFSHKVINKNMTVDGEDVVVKNLIRLTVGYTNNGDLPIAYLWSNKPAIDMTISDGEDVTGYQKNIGKNYNVHYLMPNETIEYDYLIYPSSEDRVVFEGEVFFSFMPITNNVIVNNTDYDLNSIFNPVMGAKTYTNYMAHTSQKFKINTQKGEIELIDEQPIESSLKNIRHMYFSVESSIMETIKNNGYELNNVTPIYGLRYDFRKAGQAEDFIDDIYSNIPISNNLQHTKNQYFALMDGKSIIYSPDINKLTEFDEDSGQYYDINLNGNIDEMLEETRLNIENTVAKFIKIDGYISMILFSDNNYEYIKPVEDYEEFNIVKDKLYTPEQLSQNIKANIDNFNTEKESGLSPAVEERIVKEVNNILERLSTGEKGLSDVPMGVELPKDLSIDEMSLDIDNSKSQVIVTIGLEDDVILLMILKDMISDPKLEVATFLGAEYKIVYDEKNMEDNVNDLLNKYNGEYTLHRARYDEKPFEENIDKISLVDDIINIEQDNEDMDTAFVYINVHKDYDIKIKIKDFVDECKVTGAEFINKQTDLEDE